MDFLSGLAFGAGGYVERLAQGLYSWQGLRDTSPWGPVSRPAGAAGSHRDDERRAGRSLLLLEVGGKVRERRGEACGVVLLGDAVRDVVGRDVDAGPASTAVTAQVMVIVPALAGPGASRWL